MRILFSNMYYFSIEVCTGRIFQSGPGPARMATISARPEREIKLSAPARPGPKEKLKFRTEPGPKGNLKFRPEPGPPRNKIQNFARPIFFFRFRPRKLGLSDFKTAPFSCLHIINIFFCCWFIFPQIIKTTDIVLTAFS